MTCCAATSTDGTTIGRTVAACISRGDLVPDGIVMDMLRKPVEAASRRGGYILDGFPRTVAQAEAAYRVAEPLGASVRIALHLQVPRQPNSSVGCWSAAPTAAGSTTPPR